MKIPSLEEFVDIYIDCVIKEIGKGDSLKASSFYGNIFTNVSELTLLSEESVIYLHHAFHWALFTDPNPYLEFFIDKKDINWKTETRDLRDGFFVRIKRPIEKPQFREDFLKKYGARLEKRLQNLKHRED